LNKELSVVKNINSRSLESCCIEGDVTLAEIEIMEFAHIYNLKAVMKILDAGGRSDGD